MDIFAHGIWAGAASVAANRKLKPRLRVPLAALWGMFPDLVAFSPAFILGIWAAVFQGVPLQGRFFFLRYGMRDALPEYLRPEELYHFSHSLVFFALAFGLMWWLRRAPVLTMLGWPLHILLDIPTHRAGRFGTPFLWPITDYRFNGISWGQQWFMILNWSLIAAACLALVVWHFVARRRAATVRSEPPVPTLR